MYIYIYIYIYNYVLNFLADLFDKKIVYRTVGVHSTLEYWSWSTLS